MIYNFSLSNAQWVVIAYVLTLAGFLLLGGRAADIVGGRRVYLTGLLIFTLAGVGAGFAATGSRSSRCERCRVSGARYSRP